MSAGETSIALYRREQPTKNGDYVYRRPGVRASVYVNKRIFGKGVGAPDTLTLTADTPIFRRPADQVDPDQAKARAARLSAVATRSRERADAALERARKAEADAEQASASARAAQ